jgi:hypothetical protein
MKEEKQDEMVELHEAILLDAKLWIEKANQLLEVAEILTPHVVVAWKEKDREHIKDIHSMLIAFAIENFLKALIVKTQPARVSCELKNHKEGKGNPCIFTHDINKLIKVAGVAEFHDSRWAQLFTRLTHLAVWGARYPVSTAPDGLGLPIKTSLGERCILTNLRYEEDPKNLDRVINLLKKKLE